MSAFIDLTDQTFFKLKVLRKNPENTKQGTARWDCLCECGNMITVTGGNLRLGCTNSCGCYQSEVARQSIAKLPSNKIENNIRRTPEYKTWKNIKQRCFNENIPCYSRYGGRGIIVDERWVNSFDNFLEDMGQRPSDQHSIERQNNDGNYEPNNCIWATIEEQANNRSTNTYYVFEGESLTVAQIARETGIPATNLRARLSRGRTIEEATFDKRKKVP